MKNDKIATTQLSLPKGGGAIQGIGETFQANEFTGTTALSIPIPTTPCRGFEPQLSVEYSSGSGNGTFGLGFGLTIPSISRKTSKAIPQYDETDTFLLSSAEDLVPISGKQRTVTIKDINYKIIVYCPRVEGLFAKIERWINQQTGDCYWQLVSKDNVTSIFGKTDKARIYDPENTSRVFQWLLEETFDAKGNYIVYQYKSENTENVTNAIYETNHTQTANKYIERIKYGNDRPLLEAQNVKQVNWHFEVVFDYGEYDISPTNSTPYIPIHEWKNRQDTFSTYHTGFEIRTHRLCRNILMFHRFELEFGNSPILVHATRFHYQETLTVTLLKAVESIGYRYEKGKYETKSLPPIEFDYTAFVPEGHNFEPLLQGKERELPGLNLPPDYMSVDLYGEGIPGVLYSDGTTMLYWEPEGSGNGTTGGVKYAPPKQLLNFPIDRHLQDADRMLMDLAGDGRMALVVSTSGASGYYQYDPDKDIWQNFQPFAGFPTDFHNPDNQMVDVTGDGLMDILLVEGDRLRFYPCEGEKGFGKPLTCLRENDVPMPKQGAVEEGLHFADIFGTGRQHLVRITNGTVECWPNLGYGRFGKKIQLVNAPRFEGRMDASRLFLVDIDGSGTADIVYVSGDRIQIWFNQSGNSFSSPISINLPSKWNPLNQINFADILGNGTTCLVFSENHPQPHHWCYDFCGKQKAYLLNQVDNNLGAISKITYASSTQFYLQDKHNGTPWATKLPFPVHVVEKVENIDAISNIRLVSSYSYHHGYYDRQEREFRGFGRVERQDAETLSTEAKYTDLPPVLTKTWYHTGAWQQAATLCQQYENEYFLRDTRACRLSEHKFDWATKTPSNDEIRQAHAALKGAVLRAEVYGLDGSELAENPYSVSEASYNIKLLQPQGKNLHAVFYVWERETLSYDYERNPQDPRIAHNFTIEIDEFGHVLCECAIAYGRRQLTGEELPEQKNLKATSTENSFLNRTDDIWLLGISTESKTYEITNLSLPAEKEYFDFEAIANFIKPENLSLLSWERHLYWDELGQNILPLGQVSSKALLVRSEVAVVSQQQIESVFFGALSKAELSDYLQNKGKYYSGRGYWWNPGLTQSYLGSDRFYLPATTTDPFRRETKVEYDCYSLLPKKVTDALGNETMVEAIDYRLLQPQKTRDLNDNISEVRFDALGMVILSSYFGTESVERVGFAELSDRPLEPFEMETAIADPQKYLKGAANYFYYDLFSWMNPVRIESFDKLELDTKLLWVELVAKGYLSSSGRILQKFQQLLKPNDMEISADFSTKQTEIFNIIKCCLDSRKTPVHAVNLLATRFSIEARPLAGDRLYIEYSPSESKADVQIHITYSDGFGRELQTKMRVEPGKAFVVKSDGNVEERETSTRWLSSGGKVYNNKGNPVQEYEPYYIDTYKYVDNPTLNRFGVSSVLHYDPLQRLVRVDTPKGFFTKVEFTPWEEKHYDENDTIKDSDYYKKNIGKLPPESAEYKALKKAEKFYNTPNIKILDNLGRAVREVQLLENGTQLVTHYELDIIGNQLASADPRLAEKGIKNFQTIYDLMHVALKTVSTDGGTHWMLHNVMGNPIYVKDSRNFEVTTEYDTLHRPVKVRVKGRDEAVPLDNIVDRIVYGESIADAKNRNLRGQVYQHYDSAGLVQVEAYNINGQPLVSQRQLRQAYKQEANWSDEKKALQSTIYKNSSRYDAIGRVIEEIDADGHVHRPTYHLSGSLDQLKVTHAGETQPKTYVSSIEYNPKGQRIRIVYGNGVTTSYEYEPTTFHLTQILTRRESKTLQDLNYTYDPVGNITQIADNAWKTVFNNNQKVEPISSYTYDALYRLVEATGREHPALSGQQERHSEVPEGGFVPLPNLNNAQAVETYTRRYTYDKAGNLYRIEHQGKTPRTRNLTVSEGSNRAVDSELLNATSSASDFKEFFDPNGNQIKMQGIQRVRWNYRDNIASVTIIARGVDDSTPQEINPKSKIQNPKLSDAEYYVYDSSGSRVRKVTERYGNGGEVAHIEETIYLGGVEIRQTRRGQTVTEERHCLRVMDDATCIAIRHRWTQGEPPQGVKNPQVRYQLDNHLGSATMEVDDEGQLISYEEYFPYGGTAFVAGRNLAEVKLKHYRYSGKERDASTGLYYYGMRYYAPWLGRWMSCDPAGTINGLNLYAFVGGNPIRFLDDEGYCKRANRFTRSNKVSKIISSSSEDRNRSESRSSSSEDRNRSESRSRSRSQEKRERRRKTDNIYQWKLKDQKEYNTSNLNFNKIFNNFGAQTTEVVATYKNLAARIGYDVGENRTNSLTRDIKEEIKQMLEASEPLHYYFNPMLQEPWSNYVNDYSGRKSEIQLYPVARAHQSKEFKSIIVEEKDNLSLDTLFKEITKRPPEIHHFLFKAIHPDLANQPTNLVLFQRSERETEYGPGQHELMHLVATGNHSDKFRQLLPQFTEVYKEWMQEKGVKSLYTLNKR